MPVWPCCSSAHTHGWAVVVPAQRRAERACQPRQAPSRGQQWRRRAAPREQQQQQQSLKLDSDRLTKAAVRYAAGLKEGKDEVRQLPLAPEQGCRRLHLRADQPMRAHRTTWWPRSWASRPPSAWHGALHGCAPCAGAHARCVHCRALKGDPNEKYKDALKAKISQAGPCGSSRTAAAGGGLTRACMQRARELQAEADASNSLFVAGRKMYGKGVLRKRQSESALPGSPSPQPWRAPSTAHASTTPHLLTGPF